MRYWIVILLLLVLCSDLCAQTYEFKNRKFRGAYGDGFVRSKHHFALEKVRAPGMMCEGDTVVFSIGYEGTFLCRFKWKKVGNSRDSWGNTPVLTLPDVKTTHRGLYYCCLTDISSGTVWNSDTVELKIRKRPVALIGEPKAPYMVCYGDTLTLDALASEEDKEEGDSYFYSWSGNNIITPPDFSQITIAPAESGKYGVMVNNEGCRAEISVDVEVYRPTVNIPDVVYLTQGTTLELEVDAPPTAIVDWSVGESKVENVNPLVYDGVTETTEVKVTMTDRGCVAQDEGMVYFKRGKGYNGGEGDGYVRSGHQVFLAKIELPDGVCEGEDAKLSLNYESSAVCRYKWYKVGKNDALADSAVLLLNDVDLTDRGLYYCVLTELQTGCDFFSDTVELKIKKRPEAVIGSPSSPKLICYGDTISLNASASESGKEAGDNYTYSWSGDGIVSSANMALIKVAPHETTVYTVMVSNGSCHADATVQVISYQPIVDIPDYVYISEGNTLKLEVDVPDAAKLIWTADGNVFEDINPFVYPDIRETMDVNVKMLNEGCEATDNCKVYVKRGRGYQGGSQDGFDRSCVAPVIIEQNRSEASCVATGAELWVLAGGSSLNYVWQKLNESTKRFEPFVPSAKSKVKGLGTYKLTFDPLVLDDNGVYLCQISNECGQVATDTFFLSVGGVPVLKSGLNREWDQCIDGRDSTHLNVVAVDPQGKELAYTWFKVDTISHRYTQLTDPDKYNEPYLKLLLSDKAKDEGMYLVNIQNSCGNTRDSVYIPVNVPVRIIEDSDTKKNIVACTGGNAEFSVSVSGGGKVRYKLVKVKKVISTYPLRYEPDLNHVWVGSPKVILEKLTKADEGNYVWEVDNGCGRDTLGFIALKIEMPPVITSVADTTESCAGVGMGLYCQATGEFSELKYEWYKDGRPTGVRTRYYSIGVLTASHTGNYVCHVSNTCPAVESPVQRIVVKEKPVMMGRPYIKESYCEGDSIKLDVVLGNVQADSVRWYHNGMAIYDIPGRVLNSNTRLLVIDSVLAGDAGEYRLHAYNGCGLNQSEPAKLVVDIPARFKTDLSGYADLVLCDGKNQALTVATTGTAPIRYIWTHNAKILADGFSNTIYLQNVKADTAGMYCCEIQNRCGGKVVCADIKVSHPDTFRFELNSRVNKVCMGDPDGLTAVLMGSDTNTMYYLYKEPGILVTKIHGKNIVPYGGFIEFHGLMGGNYYVVGEDTKYTQGCQYRMPGDVTITEYPLPVKYTLSIVKHFCKDQYQATLAINGSEKSLEMEYGLQKLDGKEWKPYLDKVRGTGDTIRWGNIPEGSYKVVARNVITGCTADMTNIVEVREQKTPVFYDLLARGNDSLYCANTESDVVLELTGTEASTKYTLMNGDGIYRKSAYISVWNNVEYGNYHVIAENQWGCRTEMGRQSVLTQEPPRRTSIAGGFIYCKEQTGTSLVEIKDTDKRTRYRVYQESPKVEYLDTMGTGTSVFVKVPLENKSYYVIAEDTTDEHCRVVLADTAVFKMSNLLVEADPDEHYIWSGATAQLPVNITGQEGSVTVSWQPESLLKPGESGLTAPTTLPLEERADFIVSVQDASACVSTAAVSVVIKGGKLACDIRDMDRVTSLDTIWACVGLDINLYAWVDGGDGNYEYVWRDSEGEKGHRQKLEGYSRLSDGWLILEVRSLEIVRKDSVWIDVSVSPEQFRLQPPGLFCVRKNEIPELKLSGSQTGVRYMLFYSSDNTRYNQTDSIDCTGDDVIFSIPGAYAHGGYYKIQGAYIHEHISCKIEMDGVAEIRQGAELFRISGDKIYCGEDTDTVRVDNGQQDVVYSLYRKGTENLLASHSGQAGMPFMFTGNFGSGNYFVTAEKGVCADTLLGEVHIERKGLPQEAGIMEKGSYCNGSCPPQITLTPAENNADYILMRYNYGQEPVEVERRSGNGTLLFGQHCEAGEYYVVAQNNAGCERILKDRIKIAGELLDVAIDGDKNYCDGTAGYEGTLKIMVPQDGVTYKLYAADNVCKGSFDSIAADGLYFKGLLEAGVYHVWAEAGDCKLEMRQVVTIRRQSLPESNVLRAPYTLCQGDGQLFMYNVSTVGYTYSLYRDSSGVETKLASKPGTGGTISWGGFDSIGDYYITAVHPLSECEWRLPGKYHIDKALEEYNITGNTSYCISDNGVVIGVSGTEKEVEYVLQKWDGVFGEYKDIDRLTGKGMAVAFKGYFPAGTYQVKAVRGCEKLMKGELTVSSKGMPADSTKIELVGNGCADSIVIIRIDKAEPGVVYSLYHNGDSIGGVLSGTNLQWVLDPAALGTYKVVADKNNCLYTFPEFIEIGERPFVSSLKGDAILCANLYGELYLDNWDKQAVCTLYGADGKAVGTGKEKNEKLYFSSVPVGTFYVVAARGNCKVKGEEYTIDGIDVPVLADSLLTASSCVQRGAGFIAIRGMADSLRYILKNSSNQELLNYKGEIPDTIFRNMNFDRYCIKAEDSRTLCSSNELCVEISESVSQDSLVGNFSYCEGEVGAVLRLSGSERNMAYRIFAETGELIEEITDGKLQFTKRYKQGRYVFRKERTGFMGGCFETDTIQIRQLPYPGLQVDAEIINGRNDLCAGEEYTVALKNTEPGVNYMLVQNPGTQTQRFVDTLQGTGTAVQFTQKLNEAGYYKIFVTALEGLCGLYLDTAFRVNVLPRDIVAEGCGYCAMNDEKDSCAITVRNLTSGVMYYITSARGADTLYGPGTGVFRNCYAGTYHVIGEDRNTGCKDTVARTQVISHKMPHIYTVGTICDIAGEIRTIDGCQTDSVSYYLYKNGVQIAGPVAGNGRYVTFGEYAEPGIYKIKAVGKYGCECWMRDSATIYTPPGDYKLIQEGRYCKEGVSGVTIKYESGSEGWYYFLKKGMWITDTLPGEGKELAWTSINGNRILSAGKYDLYAYNACETRLVKSLTVVENPLPAVFKLKGGDAAICTGSGVDIILSGSQHKVTYQLMFINGAKEQPLTVGNGTGGEIYLGNYSAVGQYLVYAIADSSGCRAKMDDKMFYPGATPEIKNVSGRDVCLNGSENNAVNMCLTGTLQSNVNYYLRFQSEMRNEYIDTLLAGESDLCFRTQHDTGCYYVIAEDAVSGCMANMDGQYCIGLPPKKHNLVKDRDTVRLCQGETYCINLDNSDSGVKYILLCDGVEQGKAVAGNGSILGIGCAGSTGLYQVKAFTGDCFEIMNDSVRVIVEPLPGMLLKKEYEYCELGAGVMLGVKAPTKAEFEYILKAPDGRVLEIRNGDAANQGFDFVVAGLQKKAGYYTVEATNIAGCQRSDSMAVVINPLPRPYRITGSNGEWICTGGTAGIQLDSSQTGVEYRLYQKITGNADKQIVKKYGTGKNLALGTVAEAGEYYVTGVNYTTGCENNMYSRFILKQADSVKVFKVEGVRTGYCYTDNRKGSLILQGSQSRVIYQLYQGGKRIGIPRKGTGVGMVWDHLEGMPCSNKTGVTDDGYLYEILGRDTLTGCEEWMTGKVGIIEESDPKVSAWHPNKDILRCQGESVQFNLSATGCNLFYRWKRDGYVVKETKDEFYNINAVTSHDYGIYYCEVSNSCGTIPTPSVRLNVRDSLVYLKRLEDKAVCGSEASSVVLTGYIQNGRQYEWYKLGNEGVSLSYDEWYRINPVTPESAGLYVFHAENECGVLTDTMELNIDVAPDVIAPEFRTDTICAGNRYILTVQSPDSVKWYRNGVYTGVVGNDYICPLLSGTDEGLYTARIKNACGERILKIAQLYVDDTIRVVSIRPSELVCENSMVDLYIRTAPENRVRYIWERGGVIVARDRNTYRAGPMTSDEPEYTYWINYSNKCGTDRAAIRLSVSNKLEYKDPEPQVLICAEAGKDTAIFISHPATLIASYQWYWQKHETGSDPVKLLGEVYDTLRIEAKTSNTGYYFCEIGNVCNPVTTQSTWFRVDSMPVLLSDLVNDTLCIGDERQLVLQASGGGLTYTWNIRKKDGTTEVSKVEKGTFISTASLVLNNLDISYDSCRVWCCVNNGCGEITSDTMCLSVRPPLEVNIENPAYEACGEALVVVTMSRGMLPWNYSVLNEGNGTTMTRRINNSMMDTLRINTSGRYRISRLEDHVGCVRLQGLPSFTASIHNVPKAVISGGGSACMGDSTHIAIDVIGGVGPWQIAVYAKSDSLLAQNLPVTNPIVLAAGKRHIDFGFPVIAGETYYIHSVEDTYSGTAMCEGLMSGEAVVSLTEPQIIRYVPLQSSHIGSCRDINLLSLLQPYRIDADMNRIPLKGSDGVFYVDEDVLPDSIWASADMRPGSHRISYSFNGEECPLRPWVLLQVDTLPEVTSFITDAEGNDLGQIRCVDNGFGYNLQFTGAYPFTVEMRRERVTVQSAHTVIGDKFEVQNLNYKENLSFLKEDSCVYYTLEHVLDAHGCKVQDLPCPDTLIKICPAELKLTVLENNSYRALKKPEYIAAGDSLPVRIELASGVDSWTLYMSYTPEKGGQAVTRSMTVSAKDTLLRLKSAGDYEFKTSGSACMGESPVYNLSLRYNQTGYIRLQAILEGAFRTGSQHMISGIKGQLPLYGLKELPESVADNMIDWVVVELRKTGNNGQTAEDVAKLKAGVKVAARDTCLLLANGCIVDRTGKETIGLSGSDINDSDGYYVVLEHRNHLSVMSGNEYKMVLNSAAAGLETVDFRVGTNVYVEEGSLVDHMTEVIPGGYWALSAGDIDLNALISLRDPNMLLWNLKAENYNRYDVNFDGMVEWNGLSGSGENTDWKIIFKNRHKYTEVKSSTGR